MQKEVGSLYFWCVLVSLDAPNSLEVARAVMANLANLNARERKLGNVLRKFVYDEDGDLDSEGELPIVEGPVIIKTTDYGPDRLVASEQGIKKRAEYHARGFMPWGSVPNGTAATQEMDDLFSDLQRLGRKHRRGGSWPRRRRSAVRCGRRLEYDVGATILRLEEFIRVLYGAVEPRGVIWVTILGRMTIRQLQA